MSSNTGSLTWRIGLLPLCVFLCLPLGVVFIQLLWPDIQAWQHLISTVLTGYISNSVLLAIGVGMGTLLLGGSTAWCMAQYDFSLRPLLRWSLLLPLAIPAYIIAYTYTGLLDGAGPLQTWIRAEFSLSFGEYWFPNIRSLPGAIVLMSLVLYPYVYILGRTAFTEQSQRFNEVASLSGVTGWRYFIHVSAPLARPALFTGAALAMMEALADYGTVHYFGINTFTTGIFRSWYALGNRPLASQLAGVLCLFVLILLVIEQYSRRKLRYFQSGQLSSQSKRVILSGWSNIAVSLLCAMPVIFGFLVPTVQLLSWSIDAFENNPIADFATLVGSTFMLGLVTALVVVILAVLFTYQSRWLGGRIARWQIRLLSLGYALPGMVIAVGVLTVLGAADSQLNQLSHAFTGQYVGLLLSGSLFALIFAYSIRFLSIALQNTEAGMARIHPSMDYAAETLGAGRWRLLKSIHTPLLRASLLSAVLLVFVDVLKELPATLVLRPFNFNTLAVRTYELASEERLVDAALPALTIVLVGLLPILILTKALDNDKRETPC